jgi:hypothetical protein
MKKHYCKDCQKQISRNGAQRCKSCAGKLRIWPQEVRNKISKANKGHKNSQEAIEKMRLKLKGRKVWNKGRSIFKNKEEKRMHTNKLRRLRYKKLAKSERLADLLRTRIRAALKYYCKNTSTIELLGCGISEFKSYLENKFIQGMSWENYGNKKGQWNIDHIIPISKFDLNKKEEQFKAFHYTNCQPLWAYLNFIKSNKT